MFSDMNTPRIAMHLNMLWYVLVCIVHTGGSLMFESIAVVGERGQITIPKNIRDIKGIKAKDKVVVKIENDRVVLEKTAGRKEKEELLKEYCIKYADLHRKINKEWEVADIEANRFLK
jgi:AbrB family looped-hinge helix DNA binding protein